MMSKKIISILALVALIAVSSFGLGPSIAPSQAKANKSDSLVVVELFTSQGCPACAMSNAVMSDLSKDDALLTLTWNVDYWDYMGWQDTFATKENTKRQEDYNKGMGKRGVYTPEIIINGERHIIGADANKVYENILEEKQKVRFGLDVSLDETQEKISLSVGEGKAPKGTIIRLVWYSGEETIKVGMGRNKGKDLKFTNVVFGSKIIGDWDGDPKSLSIDLAEIRASGADCIAVLVQNGDPGPILGAAKLVLS